MAVLLKQEILLLFIGGVYVIEALSVIIQVGSFKMRGKRDFQMAPLHHHSSRWDGRIEGHRAFLDRWIGVGAIRVDHVEIEMNR